MKRAPKTAQLVVHGKAVASFDTALHNYTRVAEFRDNVVHMLRSGIWRAYSHNRGPVYWRPGEFDYFLISCAAPHRDVGHVFSETKIGVEVAKAMQGDARRRRPFAQAAAEWPGDTGEPLIERARRCGWLGEHRKEPTSPIHHYSRVISAADVPLGERASFYKGRTACAELSAARRRELDAALAAFLASLSAVERRYVRACLLRGGTAGRPRLNGPISRKTAWMRRQREGQQIN